MILNTFAKIFLKTFLDIKYMTTKTEKYVF